MIGSMLLHYRIVEEIGRGGMGVVYKAIDTHLDRPVAIKVLPADRMSDPERKRRFVLEAKAASALRHPNIVVIHDVASEQGVDFIVMELVDGAPLEALIGRKGLKLGQALGIAVQIADGLARAHAAGIVHRDLKPTNVMVGPNGLVKILDFGLAKLADPGPAETDGRTVTLSPADRPATEAGFIVGTAAYMSPEQAEGAAVDPRSDIFSFGVLLYEMLTGQKAFQRDSRIKTLAAVLNEEPRSASAVNEAVPPEAERIMARCLRKDPGRRWQTASDLKVALEDLKEDSESGRLPAAARPAKRGRKRLLVGAASLLTLAGAAALLRFLAFAPEKPLIYETSRLTYDTGVTGSPSFSPDGRFVAYASDRAGDGSSDIWIQQISGGEPLRLTDHPAGDTTPAFSPDGSKIVFRSERDGGGIYIVDALGGTPRRLTDGGILPQFSPDGSLVAFVSMPASLEARLVDLYVVPAKGGPPRAIHPEFSLGRASLGAAPVWSPKGDALLANASRDDDRSTWDWWVLPLDGADPVRTGAAAALGLGSTVNAPEAWRGDDVYYMSGTTIEGVNIFRAVIDAKSFKVRGPGTALTSGPGMKYRTTLSQSGLIAYNGVTAAIDVWSVSARPEEGIVGSDLRKIPGDMMQKFSPVLTRDGRQMAYIAFGGLKGGRLEVRRRDLASGQETSFPAEMSALSFFHNPQFSRDGRLLAYRDLVAGKFHTLLVPTGATAGRDAGEVPRIWDFFPDPDFVLAAASPRRLVKRSLATGRESVILDLESGYFDGGSLSPDGRRAAFRIALPDGRASIAVAPVGDMPTPPADVVPLVVSDRFVSAPRWSPRGSRLYYLSAPDGTPRLYAQAVDSRTGRTAGGARIVLSQPDVKTHLNYPLGNAHFDVAEDKIIFTVDEVTSNIFLLTPKR